LSKVSLITASLTQDISLNTFLNVAFARPKNGEQCRKPTARDADTGNGKRDALVRKPGFNAGCQMFDLSAGCFY
jgi:hypothetical protein